MKIRKTKDEWLEIVVYGLLAIVLIGLSICLIMMTGDVDVDIIITN